MNRLNVLAVVLLAALVLSVPGCRKDADSLSPGVPGHLEGFTKYTIAKGAHYTSDNTGFKLDVTEWRFQVYFDSSAIYKIDGDDQYDVNKLSGFADNNSLHTQYSARFGWRWSDGHLRLFGFVHNDGVFQFKEISSIEMHKIYSCTIKVQRNQYLFTIEELKNTVSLARDATTATGQGYRLYPYFGGNQVAPHDISIWIRYF